MLVEKLLVTRNEVRLMGLNVSNTQFGRWEEEQFLTPFKAGNYRSAVVRYRLEQVLKFITDHTRPKGPSDKD